ncbi:MAG: hypothetical protein ACOX4C_09610 [Bacillota bacterium]
MPNLIEDIINEVLTDGVQKYALDFVAYLRANEMLFESGKGYWKDEFYWMIKFEGEYVCFIQIGGDERKDNSWTIWSDDSDSKWFEDYPLDERLRKIAWENVDICGNCGGCSIPGGGTSKRDLEKNSIMSVSLLCVSIIQMLRLWSAQRKWLR